jgi:hypothetical protein
MEYNGPERRKEPREFCSAHIEMATDIASIKTSLENIEKATVQGITFKTAIVGTMVLIILTIVGQAFLYGKLCERVDRNTGIIEKMSTRAENLQIELTRINTEKK